MRPLLPATLHSLLPSCSSPDSAGPSDQVSPGVDTLLWSSRTQSSLRGSECLGGRSGVGGWARWGPKPPLPLEQPPQGSPGCFAPLGVQSSSQAGAKQLAYLWRVSQHHWSLIRNTAPFFSRSAVCAWVDSEIWLLLGWSSWPFHRRLLGPPGPMALVRINIIFVLMIERSVVFMCDLRFTGLCVAIPLRKWTHQTAVIVINCDYPEAVDTQWWGMRE